MGKRHAKEEELFLYDGLVLEERPSILIMKQFTCSQHEDRSSGNNGKWSIAVGSIVSQLS